MNLPFAARRQAEQAILVTEMIHGGTCKIEAGHDLTKRHDANGHAKPPAVADAGLKPTQLLH